MFDMFLGAVLVGAAWLGFLTVKHGWGWVLARLHARAATAEADFQARIAAALPGALAPLRAEIDAIKGKLGLPAAAPVAAPAPASAPAQN